MAPDIIEHWKASA